MSLVVDLETPVKQCFDMPVPGIVPSIRHWQKDMVDLLSDISNRMRKRGLRRAMTLDSLCSGTAQEVSVAEVRIPVQHSLQICTPTLNRQCSHEQHTRI